MFAPFQLTEKVNTALAALSFPAQPEGLYEPVSYALAMGGKRLRPVLLLMAYSLYRDDMDQAMPAALALEIYHNHTLLHDDLMDHADLRRGHPTVHRKWNANTAILSGDVMLILAFRQLAACSLPSASAALRYFVQATAWVCEGQQMDMNFESRTDVSEAEYIEMIRLKTSVLLAAGARMGALLADAPEAEVEALTSFAEKVGLAFQLQDDYLDVYGDPALFGKHIGGDILCGKKTFLLITALARADARQRARLLRLLADTDIASERKIAEVTELYDELAVADACRAAIDRFYAEARTFLDTLPEHREGKAALWAFAASLLGRKA